MFAQESKLWDVILVTTAALAVVIVLVLVTVVRRLAVAGARHPAPVDWTELRSAERYHPMLRLLEPEDLCFLSSQPGFDPATVVRFRRQRIALFHVYLGNLCYDFRRTCGILQFLMMHSGNDRPDLARALVRAQMAFTWALVSVRFRLFLYRWGWSRVDVTRLVKLFDVMQLELRSRVPAVA